MMEVCTRKRCGIALIVAIIVIAAPLIMSASALPERLSTYADAFAAANKGRPMSRWFKMTFLLRIFGDMLVVWIENAVVLSIVGGIFEVRAVGRRCVLRVFALVFLLGCIVVAMSDRAIFESTGATLSRHDVEYALTGNGAGYISSRKYEFFVMSLQVTAGYAVSLAMVFKVLPWVLNLYRPNVLPLRCAAIFANTFGGSFSAARILSLPKSSSLSPQPVPPSASFRSFLILVGLSLVCLLGVNFAGLWAPLSNFAIALMKTEFGMTGDTLVETPDMVLSDEKKESDLSHPPITEKNVTTNKHNAGDNVLRSVRSLQNRPLRKVFDDPSKPKSATSMPNCKGGYIKRMSLDELLNAATRTGGGAAQNKNDNGKPIKTKTGPRPNIIAIIHESLGYSALFSTRGKRYTPYFHKQYLAREDVFAFPHTGAAAGTSEIASAALMTGVTPLTSCGMSAQARGASIASELHQSSGLWQGGKGYTTALYSAYGTHTPADSYANYNRILRTDFDVIVNPKTLKSRIINDFGMDDLLLFPHIFDYIRNQAQLQSMSSKEQPSSPPQRRTETTDDEDEPQPFYLQIILNHLHIPCVADRKAVKIGGEKITDTASRCLASLNFMDRFYEQLMQTLNESSELMENTIIAMSGDHGESFPLHMRPHDPPASALGTFMSFRVPDRLWRSEKEKETLRFNTMRRVTTLDFNPTLRSLLVPVPKAEMLYSANERMHNLVGESLTLQPLPDDRQVQVWCGPPVRPHTPFAVFYNGTTNALAVHSNSPTTSKEISMVFDLGRPFSTETTLVSTFTNEQTALWKAIVRHAHPRLLDHIGPVLRTMWDGP